VTTGVGADAAEVAPNRNSSAETVTTGTEAKRDVMARLENVSKIYDTAAARVTALERMTWEIGRGEAVALMGPSGCGKTTILNMLGGMDRPTSGAIWVDGTDIAAMGERQLEAYRLRKVGFVFQFFNLIPSLSAIENLELPMLIAGKGADERRHRAETLLETVGLKQKGFKRPEELSGGEQQRVAVCLALVNDPAIILADEPTGNLDSKNGLIICDLLVGLAAKEGKTVLVASHDPKVVETFPRVFHMRDGVIERAA
jgi:putative ABC transport system ATP-binding protein